MDLNEGLKSPLELPGLRPQPRTIGLALFLLPGAAGGGEGEQVLVPQDSAFTTCSLFYFWLRFVVFYLRILGQPAKQAELLECTLGVQVLGCQAWEALQGSSYPSFVSSRQAWPALTLPFVCCVISRECLSLSVLKSSEILLRAWSSPPEAPGGLG